MSFLGMDVSPYKGIDWWWDGSLNYYIAVCSDDKNKEIVLIIRAKNKEEAIHKVPEELRKSFIVTAIRDLYFQDGVSYINF